MYIASGVSNNITGKMHLPKITKSIAGDVKQPAKDQEIQTGNHHFEWAF